MDCSRYNDTYEVRDLWSPRLPVLAEPEVNAGTP
jgi:hypothetical protein